MQTKILTNRVGEHVNFVVLIPKIELECEHIYFWLTIVTEKIDIIYTTYSIFSPIITI